MGANVHVMALMYMVEGRVRYLRLECPRRSVPRWLGALGVALSSPSIDDPPSLWRERVRFVGGVGLGGRPEAAILLTSSGTRTGQSLREDRHRLWPDA